MAADTKVETISRLAQWRIDNFGSSTFKRSEPFKIAIWNWQLSIEKKLYTYIRLFPEPSRLSKEQPPVVKVILRVTSTGTNRRFTSPILERLIRTSEDCIWQIDTTFHGRLIIDVEFLDLQVYSVNGEEATSVLPNDGMLRSSANESILRCLSRMFHESIDADVTITTCDGNLKAHRAILSASSPVFHNMFLHNLNEETPSTVYIQDMSLESITTLLSYLYGTITQEDFWKHRLVLLGAANKYAIPNLKDLCEESLLEDINTGNVLERLQEAWIYQLDKLKKGCLTYLFDFGKIYDIRVEVNEFFKSADRELIQEMFHEVLTVWKPV
ncbi:hypothetical protein QVD17_10233 [Tagetes erecta]|uniref:BTB domain-containing protein n=1 Tax=Tagetes erecta TaxID=13708 RepID=A0AAD8P4L8_TARER|nr:hypothetical protein QVD17_10233 [Tagetes erecta]